MRPFVCHSNPKTFSQGGIHPADNKISHRSPITILPLPKMVFIPLNQHIGAPAEPLVKLNDKVKVGQLIAQAKGFISANIHSSVSGTVLKIEPVLDASGYRKPSIVITVEGDFWEESIDRSPTFKTKCAFDSATIKQKIFNAGIVGLGGAAFPAHVKLAVPEDKKLEYLCINGVECEPYLTSDHRLMLEKAEEIITGIRIVLKVLNITQAKVGIEENKQDAMNSLRSVAKKYEGIEIVPLQMKYPQGGERQLIKSLLNREIPPAPKGLPIDVGCVVFNVGTIFAIYEAVQKNKPCIERVVTVTGDALKTPTNFLTRIGTPTQYLLEAAGWNPLETGKIISGGPMMGKALADIGVPITKGSSGILVVPQEKSKRKEVLPCIRCSKCVTVCPLGLEPYLLMCLVERNMFDRAEEEKIVYCCDCGCCQYICPANRPLTDYLRLGKNEVLKKMREREQKK